MHRRTAILKKLGLLLLLVFFSCSGNYTEISFLSELVIQEDYGNIVEILEKYGFVFRSNDGKGETIYDGEIQGRKTAAICRNIEQSLSVSLVIENLKGTLKQGIKEQKEYSERYFTGNVSGTDVYFSGRDDYFVHISFEYP